MGQKEIKKVKIPKEIETKIEKIKNNNTKGSIYLAEKSVETIEKLINQKEKINIEKNFKKQIKKTAIFLAEAQPSMAPIFNFANQTMSITDKTIEKNLKEELKIFCKNFKKQLADSISKMSEYTNRLIENNSQIITFSNSGTILKTLIRAKEKGKKFQVTCSEARPMKEGIKLAETLGQKDINVRIVVDSALYHEVQNADLVLVGADAIFSKGFLNKIGTQALAIVAREYNVDFYVLAGFQKILPANYRIEYQKTRNPKEIISKDIKNVEPINYYFETTPLKYIKAVITENGMQTHSQINQYMKKLKLHPLFSNNFF